MRDQSEAPDDPGHVRSSLTWSDTQPIEIGWRVEATDGTLGTVVERRLGEGPEHGYLGVATDQGVLYVPDRLIRETRGETVVLSLPLADVRANAGRGQLPQQRAASELPRSE
jgi:hypothetical protein